MIFGFILGNLFSAGEIDLKYNYFVSDNNLNKLWRNAEAAVDVNEALTERERAASANKKENFECLMVRKRFK